MFCSQPDGFMRSSGTLNRESLSHFRFAIRDHRVSLRSRISMLADRSREPSIADRLVHRESHREWPWPSDSEHRPVAYNPSVQRRSGSCHLGRVARSAGCNLRQRVSSPPCYRDCCKVSSGSYRNRRRASPPNNSIRPKKRSTSGQAKQKQTS